MTARQLLLLVGAIAVAGLTACDDPFEVTATFENTDASFAVYGLSDAPPGGFTALNSFVPDLARVAPSQVYDLIFDIRTEAGGERVAYALPPAAVSSFGSAGLIKDTTRGYSEILEAPVRGYDDTTAVVIRPGDVLLLQSTARACAAQAVLARRFIYSKLMIDSIHYAPFDAFTNPDGSTIYFHMRVNPNCGFISFADGKPEF